MDRRLRYVVDYIVQSRPLQRLIELQNRLNQRIRQGSSEVNRFIDTIKARFATAAGSFQGLINAANRVSAAFSAMKHRIRNALVNTRFEVAAVGAMIGTAIGGAFKSGVKSAVDAQETLNRFNVSFAGVTNEATAALQKMRSELGLGKVTLANYLASTQDLLVGFGVAKKEAVGLSEGITRLALDLASWNNIPFDVAMRNMLSGLVGNHEALRGMRVVLTQATLERKKEQLGIKGTWKTLDEATKVYLRYKVAMDQSVNAIGDLQRTQDETSNRFKFFTEALKNAAVNIFPLVTDQIGLMASKWGKFLNTQENSFKELGDYMEILGVWMNKLTDKVIGFMSAWSKLSDSQKQFLIFVSAVSAASAPILGILVIFGRALAVTSIWTLAIVALAVAFQDIYAVLHGGAGYFKVFLDYIGVSVDQVNNFLNKLWNIGKGLIPSIIHSKTLSTIFSHILDVLSLIGNVLYKDVWPVLKAIGTFIYENFNKLAPIFLILKQIVMFVWHALGAVFAVLSGNTARITEHINAMGSLLVNALGAAAVLLWNLITTGLKALVKSLPSIMTGVFSLAINLLGQILKAVAKILGFIFKNIVSIVGSVISWIVDKFKSLVSFIGGIITSIFSKVWDGITSGFNKVVEKIKSLKQYIPGMKDKNTTNITNNITTPQNIGGKGVENVQTATSKVAPVKSAGTENVTKIDIPQLSQNASPDVTTKLSSSNPNIAEQRNTPEVHTDIKQENTSSPNVVIPKLDIGGTKGTTITNNNNITNNKNMTGPGININTVNMPIHIPEGTSGDPESIRQAAYEAAMKAFSDMMSESYYENTGVV